MTSDSEQPEIRLSFEEYLRTYGTLTYTFQGTSMLPMLRAARHDVVHLRAKGTERCHKYDVALFRIPSMSDRYILHRVIRVKPDGYDFRGDHCLQAEAGVKEDQVIGVLTAYTRGKKTRSVTSLTNRFYARVWTFFYPLRLAYYRLRAALAKIYHRVIPKRDSIPENGGRTE